MVHPKFLHRDFPVYDGNNKSYPIPSPSSNGYPGIKYVYLTMHVPTKHGYRSIQYTHRSFSLNRSHYSIQ